MRTPDRPITISLSALAISLLAACGASQPLGEVDAGDSDGGGTNNVDIAGLRDLATTAPADLTPSGAPKFSFFVTSLNAMRKYSGSQNGFGGDLRFGETGPGAGLRGADKLCATIAEASLAGSGQKGWRAFLSATNDGNGNQVHAIDRIGNGPWYDRIERLVAPSKAQLLFDRPQGGNAAIRNDLPNEDGVPNQAPDGIKVDNHDTLTGSNNQGRLYGSTATCLDWTSKLGTRTVDGIPRLGHSWPRGGFTTGSGANWINSHEAAGCAPGVNLVQSGGAPPGSNTVGAGGGYGGIYCFALTP